MMQMNNSQKKKLALDLLHADSEDKVISILQQAGLWDDRNFWRLYGDKEGNFAQAGNQQSMPEAALVEKIVNCVDSRLMCECVRRGIDPESDSAPRGIRDAVAMFFENRRAADDEAGALVNWPRQKRTEESRHITIAATGGWPTRGRKSKRMCLTIADTGEGQSPARLPDTILSLNAKNKQRIRFVQGKFNMGGSGALRFCGRHGLQLVISRRHPDLRDEADPSSSEWAFTIVRREEPTNKTGDPIHSEFTYLAPVGSDQNPRHGEVLSFTADRLPLMPQQNDAYVREVEWGTAIKLYEYDTTVGQSNVLMKDGLLYALERLLPEIALPARVYECRKGYKGAKERSFETPLAGLVVRLEEGRGDNLEPGFPLSARLRAAGMNMSVRIYAFKQDTAATYLRDEGVIFTINGQAHGYIPKSIFARPKAVGLPRLRDSLLVLVDCSSLSVRQREDLFMSSRDRLSKNPIRYELEREIEHLLRENAELRRLQNQRREQDVESQLSEERPLEEVLGKVLKASPSLSSLFLQGRRLPRPFPNGGSGTNGNGGGSGGNGSDFVGKRHPTYFRFKEVEYGKQYSRNCEIGRRCRITFLTDVENQYFDRATDHGTFELEVLEGSREMSSPSYSLTLDAGRAYLNMALPPEAREGDHLVIQATVNDPTLAEPFVNVAKLTVVGKSNARGSGGSRRRSKGSGSGDQESNQGIALPKVIPVRENDEHWRTHSFTPETACHVISDPVDDGGTQRVAHTFYVNLDNRSLLTEMKYAKQDPRLLEAKFKYGNVLLGLAMLQDVGANGKETEGDGADEEGPEESVSDQIRRVTAAVAPVLLPMIDQLAGLNDADLLMFSEMGEDA